MHLISSPSGSKLHQFCPQFETSILSGVSHGPDDFPYDFPTMFKPCSRSCASVMFGWAGTFTTGWDRWMWILMLLTIKNGERSCTNENTMVIYIHACTHITYIYIYIHMYTYIYIYGMLPSTNGIWWDFKNSPRCADDVSMFPLENPLNYGNLYWICWFYVCVFGGSSSNSMSFTFLSYCWLLHWDMNGVTMGLNQAKCPCLDELSGDRSKLLILLKGSWDINGIVRV